MEKLRIALPNGELRKDVVQFFGNVGLEMSPTDRGLFVPVENIPVEFVIVRASDVPKVVSDERSLVKAGVTGSDILWESGLGKDAGSEIPLYEFHPDANRSSLYLGAAGEYMDSVGGNFDVADLSGKMIATKYVNVAKGYLEEKGIDDVELLYVPGSDEGMQYAYSSCVGVLGIKSTGNTLRANDIRVVDQFHDVNLRMIQESGKLTPGEEVILSDFQEKMEVATLKKRPLSTALF